MNEERPEDTDKVNEEKREKEDGRLPRESGIRTILRRASQHGHRTRRRNLGRVPSQNRRRRSARLPLFFECPCPLKLRRERWDDLLSAD